MPKVFNRARMTTITMGTGTLTLGSAVAGYQTFASAGALNGDVLHYTIEEGTEWEIGTGTYNSAGPTLTRSLVQSSTGALLSLGGFAQVFITAPAAAVQSNVEITGGTITGITDLALSDGGTGASDATNARTNLGLGSIATQNANAVAITGGSIAGITDLAVVDGGTGASNASGARTNLGLGSIATQNSSNVSITGGSISGITDLAVADGGTGASDAAGARTNLGLGSIATQASNSVSITGGSITGITDLAVADGGTGASDASGARTNLGLGSIATQAANNVAITGGSISGIASLAVAAGTVSVAPITLTSGTNLTAAAAGAFEYDGKVIYATPQGTQRGVVPGMQFFRLNADLVGSNVNTVQSAFGVGVTLSSSTVYAFEGLYMLTKTAGVVSHTVGTGFGGTATLNNIGYNAQGVVWNTNPVQEGSYGGLIGTTATATAVTGAQATAASFAVIRLSGTVSINAGGTFIPQYILSAAPGGAYTMVAGSFFMIYPIGASGADVSIGTWA